MADIPFPNGVTNTNSKLSVVYPGQIIHQSPYTGSRTVINRSSGLWQGMLTFPSRRRLDREIQQFLDALTGASYSFDAPLYGRTLPAVAQYATAAQMGALAMRGFDVVGDTTFPFFDADLIESPAARTLRAQEHTFRSAAVLSPAVPIAGTSFYLSVWAWAEYQAVSAAGADAMQVSLGVIYLDADDAVLSDSTAEALSWDAKTGPIYHDDFSAKPGWNEYGIELGTGAGVPALPAGAAKVRLYLSFVSYAGVADDSDHRMAFANLGLWRMPSITAADGGNGWYTLDADLGVTAPAYARVKASALGDRVVEVKRVSGRRYSVRPYTTPASAAMYLKPAWSMEARLTGQTAGVLQGADWNQEMSIDFMENV